MESKHCTSGIEEKYNTVYFVRCCGASTRQPMSSMIIVSWKSAGVSRYST